MCRDGGSRTGFFRRRLLAREAGSALMLMPAGVLIVLLLGALAVDSAILFLGERELADLTAAAANDAATAGIDPEPFYECGRLELDETSARSVADAVAARRTSDAVQLTGLDIAVRDDADPPEVEVAATGTVRLIFTPALPGQSRKRTVDARSVAVAQSPAGSVPPRC